MMLLSFLEVVYEKLPFYFTTVLVSLRMIGTGAGIDVGFFSTFVFAFASLAIVWSRRAACNSETSPVAKETTLVDRWRHCEDRVQ